MKIARLFALVASLAMACALLPAPARAQAEPQAPALGLVARSTNGYIGNAAVTEGATVYSGDYLNTLNNGSLVVRVGGLSLELEGSSAAHIYRTPYGAIVELNLGSVVYNTPGTQENLVIVASDVRVTPAPSVHSVGRVTVHDSCNLMVYSQRAQVTVQAGSESHLIEEGKTYRVLALYDIKYNKFLSPDEDDYHRYHDHRPCAPLDLARAHGPIAAAHSRFLLVASALIAAPTVWGIHQALESPDRP